LLWGDSMIVAITPELEHLKEELIKLGHTVVTLGQYNYPIDVIVYTGYSPDISYTCSNNTYYKSGNRQYGVLMVNASNKDIKEIAEILRTRLYSPLF